MMSRNNKKGMTVIYEGWLTKSPPTKRVWRAKWRRRWFTLRHSPEEPSHYFLDYYTDRNTRKLKGTIDLNSCEQVDAGLEMPGGNSDSKESKGSVFSIRTRSRIYHLEADSVTDMEKWVDIICQACGMRATQKEIYPTNEEQGACNLPSRQQPSESSDPTGHYISIADCFTGLPTTSIENPNEQKISNARKELAKAMIMNETVTTRNRTFFANFSLPKKFLRGNENQSYISQEKGSSSDKKSSSSNSGNSSNSPISAVCRRFTKMSFGDNSVNTCTAIPPRPPKPLRYSLDVMHKEIYAGPRIREPTEVFREEPKQAPAKYSNMQNKVIYANSVMEQHLQKRNETEGYGNPSRYYNLNTPPIINRELKPGRREMNNVKYFNYGVRVPHTLQYLDLDLDTPSSNSINYNDSLSHSPTNYNKVDFLKTTALNKTRLDNETSRRQDNHYRLNMS